MKRSRATFPLLIGLFGLISAVPLGAEARGQTPAEPTEPSPSAPQPSDEEAREQGPSVQTGPSLSTMRGLYRMWTAETYAPESFVFSAALEFFHLPDFLAAGDQNSHARIHVGIGGVPVEGLELTGGFGLLLNDNTQASPNTMLTLGEPHIGIRYGRSVLDWLAVGGGLQVRIPSGLGVGDLAFEATSMRAALSVDFRPTPELFVGLHVGFHLDRSAKAFEHTLSDVQSFAGGVNPHHQVEVGVGISYQFGDVVAPYLEYFGEFGVNAEVDFSDQPQRLALGARFWPLKRRSLHVLFGVEVGVGGADAPAFKARVPWYNLVFGLAWDFGQSASTEGKATIREVVKIQRVEVATDGSSSRIDGTVVDANTGKPIFDARVVLGDADPFIVMSDRTAGKFKTPSLTPGPLRVVTSAEGYLPSTTVVLVKKGETVPATIKLQPATGETFGWLKGTVRSVGGKELRASVVIPTRKKKVRADKTGAFSLKLKTGEVDVLISHKGYITQRHKIRLRPGEDVILNIELYPK